jgi:hypothetical protein
MSWCLVGSEMCIRDSPCASAKSKKEIINETNTFY